MFSPLIQYSVASTPHRALRIVKAVGCLIHDQSRGWMLTRGGEPTPSSQQGTSSSELNADANIRLRAGSISAVGVDMFQPSQRSGQKVAVKGVLSPALGEPRINVTSLQATSSSCTN